MRTRLTRAALLAALAAALLPGCSSDSLPTGQTGKEVEAQQAAEQKKADDDEKQEIKNRRGRSKQ